MQIWAEPRKSALPICNYSQILYQFLTFTQNLKRSPPDYLMTYCKNFIMAFPLQLIFVGPLARLIFRTLFINHKKKKH